MNNEVTSVQGRVQNAQAVVGTTRSALVLDVLLVRGVTITALSTNTGIVYVGGPEVATTSGYPLAAGQSIFLPTRDIKQVNLVASLVAQNVAWIAI
jgi:hypothetical protein